MNINLKLDMINIRLQRMEMKLPPLTGAKLFFYESGTTNPQSVWADAGFNIDAANPVIADENANFPDCFVNGPCKVELRENNGYLLFIKEYYNI